MGGWEHKDGGYAYEFEADGSGTYKYGETGMPFTFEADGSELLKRALSVSARFFLKFQYCF